MTYGEVTKAYTYICMLIYVHVIAFICIYRRFYTVIQIYVFKCIHAFIHLLDTSQTSLLKKKAILTKINFKLIKKMCIFTNKIKAA